MLAHNLDIGEECMLNSGSPDEYAGAHAVAAALAQPFTIQSLGRDLIAIYCASDPGNAEIVTVATVVPSGLRFDCNAVVPGSEDSAGIATFGHFKGANQTHISDRKVH
jgi:hypothetical protein